VDRLRVDEVRDLFDTSTSHTRGHRVRKIDRTGRAIDYVYDSLSRQTSEAW
jgi:hypothetical protein